MDEQSRLDEVQRLFDAVRDVPAGQREGRLHELCDDAELRQEAMDLLAFDHEGGLDGLEVAVQRALAGEAEGPPQLDGFTLGEVIGAGAMGVVYRAEQMSPRRTVAVKALRGGPGSAGLIRRFQSESEALGRLRHPGIATVHHAGVLEAAGGARPYLVMEYVEGAPLDEWLASAQPDVRRRLALMAEICDAVQHAHTHGVIHRDLKPSNILITPDGAPKVIDFGVARITEPGAGLSVHTAAGEMIGTVAYMSPEQLSGDPAAIDTRSDVYALGVVLFSMLAGELPHDVSTMSLAAAARAVEQGAARRLGQVRPELRGDIDIIVSHALEKDKQRRYQTAEALGDDIRRYLAGLPINARPPSALYVLGRLARRHRAAVAVAALVAVALVAAAVIASRNAVIAQRALAESRRAEQRVQDINDFLLVDLLQAGHSQYQGVNARVVDVIDRAIPVIGERFRGDPLGEAKVRRMIAELLLEAGRPEDAVEQLRLGLAALDQRDAAMAREALELMMSRVRLRLTIGQPDLAEADARTGLRLADDLDIPEGDPIRVQLLGGLGGALQSQGRYAEGEAFLRQAIDSVMSKGPPYPSFVAGLHTHLYQAVLRQGGDAEQLAAIVATIIELAESEGDPGSLMLAASLRASRHAAAGEWDAAIAQRRRAIEIARAAADPLAPTYRIALIQAAGTLRDAGRPAEAIPLMLEGHDLFVQALGPYHYDVERICGWLAELYGATGEADAARQWRLRNLVLRFYIAGPTELESLQTVARHGAELLGGEEAFVQALLEEAESLEGGDPSGAALVANLGRVLAERDDPRAEGLLAGAVAAVDAMTPEQRPQDVVARVRAALPPYLERAGRPQDAAAWVERLDTLGRSFEREG